MHFQREMAHTRQGTKRAEQCGHACSSENMGRYNVKVSAGRRRSDGLTSYVDPEKT